MWKKKPLYNLNSPVTRVVSYTNLPPGCRALKAFNLSEDTDEDRIIFIDNNGLLSILYVSESILASGQALSVNVQTDVTFQFLDWFPKNLVEFMKPPAEGGLHAGAMITADEDVDGEMLSIYRIQSPSGYGVINRSRCHWRYNPEKAFEDQRVRFTDYVLFDGGMLDWMRSGSWKND